MKRTMSIFALIFAICFNCNAIVVQKITLKNGTVLNGYIQQQDNNENIIFRSDNATVCINGKNATTTERVYRLNELDKKWIDWAEKNDAFTGSGDARTLTLNEILFTKNAEYDASDTTAVDGTAYFDTEFKARHTTIVKVKVLEKGLKLKYLELTPNTYTFNWKDVESIQAEKRAKTALTGVDRIYQLKNGQEIRGQYAGETYNTLSLYTSSGLKETFDIGDVVRYLYKGINPNQDIFEQSELLDVVRTKSSGTYNGIIVERNFTEGNNYLVIQQQSGSSQILKFSDISEYSKEENSMYAPKYDIILKHGEVVINRVATDSVGVSKNGTSLVLDSINHKVVIPKGTASTKIAVEYNNPQHLSSEHLILVKVDKSVVKKQIVYSFSTDIYEMKKFTPVKTETSVNNTTRIEYDIIGQGVFALYDQNTRKAIPFIVK